jgi:hypothetical protein
VGLLWKEKEKMIHDVLIVTIIVVWLLTVVWILAP